MKVAIVHDWLVVSGGAEKVLERIIECFPHADIYTLVDFLEDRTCVKDRPVYTSFIQKLPMARKRYRGYLPLMPLAIEQLDLSAYDLVISSSYAVAKGVLTGPDQLHVSYVHSPIRYAWDLQHQYLKESGLASGFKSVLARLLLHYIRGWDARSANGVDHLLANSHFIARRIKKAYQRESTVIYPPVDVRSLQVRTQKDDFYLTASRMVPYKRIDLIVKAFSKTPDRRLVVIGDGPDMKKIKAQAGPNVEIMGYQSFEVLHDHLQRARAFVYAAEEDFGISIIEAQACGTPVVTFGKGGALESVIGMPNERPTGVFFKEQTEESLLMAVERFERNAHLFDPKVIRENAERFSTEKFKASLSAFVEVALARFRAESTMAPRLARAEATAKARIGDAATVDERETARHQ
ncbi:MULTISPECIES: glycosyltransferase family 4 protein [unclassified Caballeronia]|uniref:glycosyltransferase family 4 protein n=1 Tax=unclassified Caballeronia TaxID=2646786 RepID=UPI00285C6E88|nr:MULTISPECIES: glycosyltransferase family 4 protein [unclassified Caballeronia]MDR5752661.1 glycosyltransferase family 4 protein [Caballeronia sp. LZ024]MDR5841303.1 glycosyltransferase family 4 protein [Caballeronia sp. LZ031]